MEMNDQRKVNGEDRERKGGCFKVRKGEGRNEGFSDQGEVKGDEDNEGRRRRNK